MANNFKNKVINNVGTTVQEVLSVPSNARTTVIGLSLTNLVTSFVYVDVIVKDDTNTEGYYVKQTLLPANMSLRLVTNGEKLILAPDNVLSVKSSDADSIDVILSYVETV